MLPCCFLPCAASSTGASPLSHWGNTRKTEQDFLRFARLVISAAACWSVNTRWFRACSTICHPRKRCFPSTPKLQHCPPCLYPTPALALLCWHLKYCWVRSTPTMPVWRQGYALLSLTHSFSGSLETASGAGVTSRAANWATGSLTQIRCAKTDLTSSSLDICHAHLPFAAPLPCTAGEPGVLVWGRDFLAKTAQPKSRCFFLHKIGRPA